MKKINCLLVTFLVFCISFELVCAQASSNIATISGITNQGIYYIRSASSTDKCLDVANALTADGTNVQQYTYNPKAKCQQWILLYTGTSGEYKIKDSNSGSLLSIAASSATAGINAWIWHDDGTDGQVFKIRENSDGTYSFLSKCSQFTMALDINSNNLRQYYDNGTANQKFYLERVRAVLIGIAASGHDHTSYFQPVKSDLEEMSYPVNTYSTVLSEQTCIDYTTSSKVFISRSHGGKDDSGTYIVLDNGLPFGSGGISNLPSNSYRGVALMVFVGCYTGYGSVNMPKAAVAQGAATAIGFAKSIDCTGANTWIIAFIDYLNAGNTVQNACQLAQEYTAKKHWILNGTGQLNTDSYVLEGSKAQVLD